MQIGERGEELGWSPPPGSEGSHLRGACFSEGSKRWWFIFKGKFCSGENFLLPGDLAYYFNVVY